jgi:protein-S-isoprenylcysteine O-methyltransferase Ste14
LRWLLRAVYFLSLAGFTWSLLSLGEFDPFGIIPILNYLRGTRKPAMPLTVCGPYRLVRHPLYILLILMIWSYPNLTLDRLLFNVLCTAWMVLGTLFEERDLVATFGDDYRKYQQQVPMLIPYRPSLYRKTIDGHG